MKGRFIQRYRRRGMIAYLRRAANWITRVISDEPEGPERPFRAKPGMIFIRERYHYSIKIERNTTYNPDPDKTVGLIFVDLPFDQMGKEAIADTERNSKFEPGHIIGRYGWLGFTNVIKTDIHERFTTVRSWPTPYFRAFPMVTPLLDDKMALLEQRIEAGWHEREFFNYTPATPRPFPFRVNVFMSRDCQVQAAPDSIDPDTQHTIGRTSTISSRQLAIHVQIEARMKAPPDGTEDKCDITLERFDINWPVPLVAEQFSLVDAPDGELSVDSRSNRLRVSNIKATMISRKGLLHGFMKFRIIVIQPALLEGVQNMTGELRLGGTNTTLSGMRAQYFDALGYPQNTNPAGKPLFTYKSEVWSNFEFQIAEALREPPMLLERSYSWISNESCKSTFSKIKRNLVECRFDFEDLPKANANSNGDELDDGKGYEHHNHPDDHLEHKEYAKWRVRRILNGQALIVDVMVEKQELPRTLIEPLRGDQQVDSTDSVNSMFMKPLTRSQYDLKINAYYRGQWRKATEQLETLEERLRQRLQLRQRM